MPVNYSDVPACVKELLILHLVLQVFECISKIQQSTGPHSKAGDLRFSQRETLVGGIYKGDCIFLSKIDTESERFQLAFAVY